jgi:hypothetical protein
VTFHDNGNGTAGLAGIPGASSSGTYVLTITAQNGVSPDATQAFTLTVSPLGQAPAITSAAGTTFTVGSAGSFMVRTTGSPTPALSEAGALPLGVAFHDNGDGTATLAGTPAAGNYVFTITARNGVSPDATQTFTLTVSPATQAPAIISNASTTFTVGSAGAFAVTATGSPTPSLSETGVLPSGVTFTGNGSGTATLAGTPADGSSGTYTLTFTADNGVSPDATQTFTLALNPAAQPPAITSAPGITFTMGGGGSFTVTATGSPPPSLSEGGALPAGVTFHDNGNGTATLAGAPAPGTAGTYTLTVTAHNGTGSDATQTFSVVVAQPTVPPPPPVRGITAHLDTVRVGKRKKRYFVAVDYADTGALKTGFPSPFQRPAFKDIQVAVLDTNGDGVADTVVVTARKGNKTMTATFPG